MIYDLEFKKEALKEWNKLDQLIKEKLKKIEKILQNPRILSARLSGYNLNECCKIKLRQSGYRLVYEVVNDRLIVIVIGVGKRNRNKIYKSAKTRL